MKQIVFTLTGFCTVPDWTAEVPDITNHFRLPSGQMISIQPVLETASDTNADDHRDLAYTEAVDLDLFLECETRTLELEEETG